MQYATDDPEAMQEDKVLARMRACLGLPDSEFTIHKISTWVMEGVIADKFRDRSVFFAGDAAHRHPPTGGLGLNSAVHDVYNLCWKLAAVLAGRLAMPCSTPTRPSASRWTRPTSTTPSRTR